VFDPKKTGDVGGAAQLFGDHTFGGPKPTGFLPVGLTNRPQENATWKNGYEPLALLDRDGDKKLAGAELDALSLWFDYNRDGITGRGEIQDISKAGVTALYVEPDKRDERGHLYAVRGFERVINGEVVQGTSVDWYASYYPNKLKAISETQRKYPVPASDIALDDVRKDAETPSEPAAVNQNADVSGAWMWQVTDDSDADSGPAPMGLLTLRENRGTLTGHSYVEVPIQHNSDGRRSYIKVSVLDGTVRKTAEGELQLTFEVITNGEQSTKNVAYLDSSGTLLRGTSSTQVGGREVNYAWEARRQAAD
jgi:hypothetical protein